ncbi:MAG: hypothetical protein ACR2NN_02800 [Bryobacteraceae bacterium]
MNSNILLAFLGGAVLASAIVYMAVKDPAPPVKHVSAASKPIYVTPAEVSGPATPPVEDELPGEPPVDRPAKKVQREKRSPMPSARVRSAPKITTADLRAPAVVPEPAPASQQPPAYTPLPAVPQPVEEPLNTEPPPPSTPQPHTVTITAGTLLPVRIGETLTASHNQPGDGFLATLDQPLVVDGFVIAERGARLEGRVVEADPGGRVRGTSYLDVELVKLATSDGQHIRIRTSSFQKQSQASVGTDAAKVAVGAAIGAAIGGIAGGGKGAGIGAGVGGAAGAGDVLLTRGKPAAIPVETRISFRLQEPVTITERLR